MCEAEFCCDEGQWLADQDQYEREKKANGDSLVRSMQKRIESQREELRRLNNHIRNVEQSRNTRKDKATMLGNQLHDVLTAKQPEWISVEERLPDRVGKYLVFTFDRRVYLCDFIDHYCDGDFQFDDYRVTHWMPLPMPPKGDEE